MDDRFIEKQGISIVRVESNLGYGQIPKKEQARKTYGLLDRLTCKLAP